MIITEKDIGRKFINRIGEICEIVAFDPVAYKDCPVEYSTTIFKGRLPTNGKAGLLDKEYDLDFLCWYDSSKITAQDVGRDAIVKCITTAETFDAKIVKFKSKGLPVVIELKKYNGSFFATLDGFIAGTSLVVVRVDRSNKEND